MKKRLLCFILALSAAFAVTGCTEEVPPEPVILPAQAAMEDPTGYRVDSPMEYPDYTFDSAPTNTELRMTAVRAMRDTLSVRWSCSDGVFYYKTGPVSQKFFQYQPDTTYGGVIYSNASTGIIQFMEYYDRETGRLLFPGDGDDVKQVLGSSCADCLIWGWNTVCNSVIGPYYPNTMVYSNGYLPVGDYTYDYTILNFNHQPTYDIIKQNGEDVILDAYTKILPADALVSSSDNHGMMAIEAPHVVYNEDGSINREESYVTIQDQRGGTGSGFYEVEEDGQIIQYSGRTSYNYTFAKLLEKHFIPVTTAEFAGTKAYEAPEVTATAQTVKTLEELLDVTVRSNYPLAVVNAWVEDVEGNRILIDRKCFGGAADAGVPKKFIVGRLEGLKNFASSEYNQKTLTVRIEVVSPNGERFIPVSYII